MANKGNSGHIKKLHAPAYFGAGRKGSKYVTRPNPGRHTLTRSVPLSLVLKKMAITATARESRRAIVSGSVSVNGRQVRNQKYPVGLGDVVGAGGSSSRIWINRQGRIELGEAGGSGLLYKVVGKYKGRGGNIMIRLHDGTVMGADGKVSVNDSVFVKDGKIEKHMQLAPGVECMVIDGVHLGAKGRIVQVVAGNMHKAKSVIIEDGPDKFETLVRNIMVS